MKNKLNPEIIAEYDGYIYSDMNHATTLYAVRIRELSDSTIEYLQANLWWKLRNYYSVKATPELDLLYETYKVKKQDYLLAETKLVGEIFNEINKRRH